LPPFIFEMVTTALLIPATNVSVGILTV